MSVVKASSTQCQPRTFRRLSLCYSRSREEADSGAIRQGDGGGAKVKELSSRGEGCVSFEDKQSTLLSKLRC